jgi:hypothetical protein
MVGQRRKHSLPAGVLPGSPREGAEDGGSRVRARAPAPAEEGSRTHDAPKETPAEHARSLVDRLVKLGPDEIDNTQTSRQALVEKKQAWEIDRW